MKKILFILLILVNRLHAQDVPPKIETYISKNAFEICNKLHIKIRPNILKDSTIEILVNNSDNHLYLNAAFHIGYVWDQVGAEGDSLRYYLRPKIMITPMCYQIITKQIDTTKIMYYKALGVVIHEFVHYLQIASPPYAYYTPTNPLDNNQMHQYLSQEVEFEATIVESYFVLNQLDKKKLRFIMKQKTEDIDKQKQLINAYYSLVYPWRKYHIFE